jgi:hypothetical protein
MNPVKLFGEVGSDTAIKFNIRVINVKKEFNRIKEKLINPHVPDGKKEKLRYRKKVIMEKHWWLIVRE